MMKAEDIMTKEVVTIRACATVATAVGLMKEKGLRALVVDRGHENDAYGIVTETDIVYKVTAYAKDPKQVRVYEIMSKPCIVVDPDLSVEYVARLFANTGIRRAPVIRVQLLGIISVTDILRKSDFVESPVSLLLEEKIQKATKEARAVCATYNDVSTECATAWDDVEELRAGVAHLVSAKNSFEEYCAKNPDAPECRNYYED